MTFSCKVFRGFGKPLKDLVFKKTEDFQGFAQLWDRWYHSLTSPSLTPSSYQTLLIDHNILSH